MSTILKIQRKEILVDPYRLVYEDITGNFSLTNLDGYAVLDGTVATHTLLLAETPAAGDFYEVLNADDDPASGSPPARFGRKRYYYDGASWILADNALRSEVALFLQAIIHRTDGDVIVTPETYDPESVTEFTLPYDEDGWYEVQFFGARYDSTTQLPLVDAQDESNIWPNGALDDLHWNAGADEVRRITTVDIDAPPNISYLFTAQVFADVFTSTYAPGYETTLEDFPNEYLCDCQRTSFDQYMDEKTTQAGVMTETVTRLWNRNREITRFKVEHSNAVGKSLYGTAQKIIERVSLDCACVTC